MLALCCPLCCSWTPPNWVFPAVWIPLKVLQSVSDAAAAVAAVIGTLNGSAHHM
jgi:hypothetical protein